MLTRINKNSAARGSNPRIHDRKMNGSRREVRIGSKKLERPPEDVVRGNRVRNINDLYLGDSQKDGFDFRYIGIFVSEVGKEGDGWAHPNCILIDLPCIVNKISRVFYFSKSLQAAALAVVALSLLVGLREESMGKELTMLGIGVVIFGLGRLSERIGS